MGRPPVLGSYGVEGEGTKADRKVKSIRGSSPKDASLWRGLSAPWIHMESKEIVFNV
jgi:hypothetical protein